MAALLASLFQRTPKFHGADGLREFLRTRSAFVSQKCTYEYCRARAGLMWDKLMLEQAFLDAVEVSRWEALVAVYGDLALIVEGWLRPALPDRRVQAALAEILTAEGAKFLAGFPLPTHRREHGWGQDMADLRARLSEAQLAPPRQPQDIARTSGDRIYETLPIHTNFKNFDRELVVNSVRFQFVRVNEDMQRQCDRDSIIRELFPQPAS